MGALLLRNGYCSRSRGVGCSEVNGEQTKRSGEVFEPFDTVVSLSSGRLEYRGGLKTETELPSKGLTCHTTVESEKSRGLVLVLRIPSVRAKSRFGVSGNY